MSTAKKVEDRIRVVIADDHEIVRMGLRYLLECQPDMEVVGEAEDGYDAVNLVSQLEPDVLLLDLAMPQKSGLEVLRELADAPIQTKIMLLTVFVDKDVVLESIQLGVRGVVLKDLPI